jgi:LacI family transcriptional regulator
MRQIAAAAGVSASAVSMALRGHPRVSAELRDRICKLADDMGYAPNPSVNALLSRIRSGRPAGFRETIAWLNFTVSRNFYEEQDPLSYWGGMWVGARARAAQLGFEVESFWLGGREMTAVRLSKILAARGIRGVLVPMLSRAHGHVRLDWSRLAPLALSYSMSRPEVHSAVANHRYNLMLVLRRLRKSGYQKIGLVLPVGLDERVRYQYSAFFLLHQEETPTRRRVPILKCNPGELRTEVGGWLRKHRPDAVITTGEFRGIKSIQIGDKAYIRDLGVVLLGWSRESQGFDAVSETPERIAAAGVDHLAQQLTRNECGIPDCPETILIKGEWVEGTTLHKVGSGAEPPETASALL